MIVDATEDGPHYLPQAKVTELAEAIRSLRDTKVRLDSTLNLVRDYRISVDILTTQIEKLQAELGIKLVEP